MPQSAALIIRIGLRGAVASALLLAAAHLAAPVLPGNILFGSCGALAVVPIALEKETAARPVVVIVAHPIAAAVGYSLFKLSLFLPELLILSPGIGLVLAAMAQANTIHPPAGGLVFVALAPGAPVDELGLFFCRYAVLPAPLFFGHQPARCPVNQRS